MLVCLFFLFCGSNAIQTFFALFAEEVLGIPTAGATRLLLIFALSSMAATIPAGWAGKKFGRRRVIFGGLLAFIFAFLLYLIVSATGIGSPALILYPVLILGGAANMFITVNTLPLVLEIGGQDRIGTFTGYYYTATFSAQIVSPIVYGLVRVFSGTYLSLFWYSPAAFALSILCLLFVRHGRKNLTSI
jgi:MFS family permease